MGKEERNAYTIKTDENLGEVKIADEVVAIIAGLAAQGETQVMHPQYIDRGYAHFEENLRALGADVYRI